MAKYRNVRMLAKNQKESAAIQRMLFDDGCKWASGCTDVKEWGLAMYVSPQGVITHSGYEQWGVNKTFMPILEVTFKSVVEVDTAKVVERPRTVLFGKTYFTDELNEALAKLETV